MKKRLLLFIAALMLCASCQFAVQDESDELLNGLLADFFEAEAEGYILSDDNGNNITTQVYYNNLPSYHVRDFDAIKEYLGKHRCTIGEPVEHLSSFSPMADSAIGYETVIHRYTTLYSSSPSLSPYWEINYFSYAAIGSYEYDTSTKTITNASTVLEISPYPGQRVGDCYITSGRFQEACNAVYKSVRNVDNSAHITEDGKSCTFGIAFIAEFQGDAAMHAHQPLHDLYLAESFVVQAQ